MPAAAARQTAAAFVCGSDAAGAALLEPLFEIADFAVGQPLFTQGADCKHLLVVLDGTVKLVDGSLRRRRRLARMLLRGDNYGAAELFDDAAHAMTGVAHTPVRVARLARTDVVHAIETHPRMTGHFLRLLQEQLDRDDARRAELVSVDVSGRIARNVLELADRFGVPHGPHREVVHDLTQIEFAHLIGASRESVNKSLNRFVARGWVRLSPGQLTILDEDRLHERAALTRRPAQI